MSEINDLINVFDKCKCNGININKKYRVLKELRTLKKQLIINCK